MKEPKYKIGDTVWLIQENKIQSLPIIGYSIDVEQFDNKWAKKGDVTIDYKLAEEITEESCRSFHRLEEDCFPTKESTTDAKSMFEGKFTQTPLKAFGAS